jgi:catechol 2,3-dioxygenase
VGQVSFIVPSMAALRELNQRFKAEHTKILRTVTHGISNSIYFEDPEGNVVEVYYKTGFNVKQGFGAPIDLEAQTDDDIMAFAKSCEKTQGPFQGAKLPVGAAN